MNLQEELKALKQRIAELEEQAKEEQEFPQLGNTYYCIDQNGRIARTKWDEATFDLEVRELGNVFRTKEDAEFAVEKLKVEAELRKFSKPWNLEKNQYAFSFDWECGGFEVEYPDYNQYPNNYYFDSVKTLRLAIETVGIDRIKKYIFGVED